MKFENKLLKSVALLLSLTLVFGIFVGCNKNKEEKISEDESSSVDDSSSESSEEAIDVVFPLVSLDIENFIYYYSVKDEKYEKVKFSPPTDMTFGDLLVAASGKSGLSPELVEVRREGKKVVIAFTGKFIDSAFTSKDIETEYLTTVAKTVIANDKDAEEVVYMRDDKGYSSKFTTIPMGTSFELPDIVDPEEFESIRKAVKYPGLTAPTFTPNDLPGIAYTSAIELKIAEYLVRIGIPQKTINQPSDLDNQYVLSAAIESTASYLLQESSDATDSWLYDETLIPIIEAVEDDSIMLSDHIDETIKTLFGNVSYSFENVDAWKWHSEESVYTPPHMGGGGAWIPIILSNKEEGSMITLEVTYGLYGMGSYVDDKGDFIGMSDSEAIAYFINNAPRYKVVLNNSTGNLQLQSFVPMGQAPIETPSSSESSKESSKQSSSKPESSSKPNRPTSSDDDDDKIDTD